MALSDLIEAHKELITDRLDPDFGLLDELLASRSLTRHAVAKVKAVSDSYGRSEKLLEYVSDKGIYEKFLDALRDTQQTHLANFIRSNGERRSEFGDDWPLTEREISILDTNQRSLVDLLETCELLRELYSRKVINNRQRDFVSSKTTSHEKNDTLLEILKRTSLENYKKTIYCLQLSKQSHIAHVLKEGGGVVRVRSELETESDVNEVEVELITKITEMFGDRSLEDSARLLESLQLRLIAVKRGNSIILYFFCKTSAELVNLQEMQASGKLANVVSEMFSEMLSRPQIINLKITLYEKDFSKCELCFRSVGDKGESEESCDADDGSATSNATAFGEVKMEDAGDKAEKQLREITQCPICMSAFIDPRMLPCIHTFCFQCLKGTTEAAQKKTGHTMPCPLCRKEFIIPREGIVGLQRNFIMENLLEYKTTLQRLKLERETENEIKRTTNVKSCTKHTQKPLDYYCVDCKKSVCVSCVFESHKLHDCKDVTTVDEEFRRIIEKHAWKTSNYADEMLSLKRNEVLRKADFLKKIVENETAIIERSQELKNMIDKQTNSLLDELSHMKSCHLKELESEMEETERYCIILRSFEAYCTELISSGSASDICSSIDQLIVGADDLEKDHEAFIGRPRKSVEVSFKATDLTELLQMVNNNVVGQIKGKTEDSTKFENCAILVRLNDRPTITNDVIKINLQRPNNISARIDIPTRLAIAAFAAVYCNTMYVTGVGFFNDQNWKYNIASGWMKCASLVQGRRRHSAAFIDEVLYICGGFVDSNGSVLNSVEAYSAIADTCAIVGKLVHCVQSSGNCVPFTGSLYIFGGADKDYEAFNHVQIYNTKQNTCTLLSKPMPRPNFMMRAALWETSVILVGRHSCFIFDNSTETWQEREQFKTDVVYFGLVLENERVFVIGGGIGETDKDGKFTWKCRDDVRYVPLRNIIVDEPIEWKIHGNLPKPALVFAYANMRFLSSC